MSGRARRRLQIGTAALTGIIALSDFAGVVGLVGGAISSGACRSETQPVWRQRLGTNRPRFGAVTAEFVPLGLFLGLPPLARLLGGSWPTTFGWALASCAVPIVIIIDGGYKAVRRSCSQELAVASVRVTSGGRT